MRFKIPFLFSLVLACLFLCNLADAAAHFDTDVGDKVFVKSSLTDNDNYQPISFAAYEPAPALIRLRFAPDIYKEPKTDRNLMIWQARINHNYPFQLPSKAGPPSIFLPLRE